MPGAIDRAFVEIVPEFRNFASRTKAGIAEGLGTVKAEAGKAAAAVEQSFSKTGAAVAQHSKAMGARIGAGARAGEKEAAGAFGRIRDSGKEAFKGLGGGQIAGLFAVGGAIEFGKKSVDVFENTARSALALQRQFGGTVHEASAFTGAMQLAGLSGEQFSVSIRTLSKQVLAAAPPMATVQKAQNALATAQKKLADMQTLYAAKANLSAGAQITLRKAEQAVTDAIKLHGAGSQQAAKAEQTLSDTRTRLAAGAKLSVAEELKLRDAHAAVTKAQQTLAASLSGAGGKGAFVTLGINVRDAAGHMKPMGSLIEEVANKFQKMAPGAQKNALAIQLFGRAGLQLLPFLNRGASGIEALKKKAEGLGIVIGDKQAAAFKKSVVAHREFTAGIQGMQIQIGAFLLPILDKFFEIVNTKIIPGIKAGAHVIADIINVSRDFVHWLDKNKTALLSVAAVITTFLLPTIISFGVQSAISFGETVALWTLYGVEALINAAKGVAAFIMTNLAGIGAAVIASGAFAIMIAGWVRLGVQALINAAKVAAAWLIALGPIGIVIAVIVALVLLIVLNWDKVWKYTRLIWGYIWGFFKTLWHDIYVLFSGALTLLYNAGVNLLNGLWNGLKYVWTLLWFWYVTLPSYLLGLFAKAVSWLYNAGAAVLSGLWNGLKAVWSNLWAWYYGLAGLLLARFGGAWNWLVERGKQILTGLWNGLKTVWHDVVSWFGALPSKILGVLGIHSPPNWAIDAGKHIMLGILKGVISHAGGALGFMKRWTGQAVGSILSGFQGQKVSANVQMEQQYAASLLPMFGWTISELQSLINLWNGESGWNPSATNASSGAYGIPQSLPANKMASAGPDWMTNPATQIRWGMQYIKDAYGSPSNAWQTWLSRSPHWYERGAWNIPGLQAAVLHPHEMVVPTPFADSLRQALSARPAGGRDEQMLARALAAAFTGLQLRFDADGVARLISARQAAGAVRGGRR